MIGKIFAFSLLIFFAACGAKPTYQPKNFMSPDGVTQDLVESIASENFYTLPLNGEVADKNKFWSGDFWPMGKGNINYRWNSYDPIGFNLDSPTREEALLSTEIIFSLLSPSEKYDLWTGNYHYPIVLDVASRASRDAEYWEGICDGWAPATLNHREPTPKTMTNPDGIKVPFGSSDIKALLSYYYAYYHQVRPIHERPHGDLNPGTFHIIMTNKIGVEKLGFIAGIKTNQEVWNHPVMKYDSIVDYEKGPQEKSVPRTKRTVFVKTRITYVDVSEFNTWTPLIGTAYQIISHLDYEYILDLDQAGNIIGGEWVTSKKPDFLWGKSKVELFTGKLPRLGELLND